MFCSVVGPPALCVRINAREMREGRKGAAQDQESPVLLPSCLVDFGICEASSQFSEKAVLRSHGTTEPPGGGLWPLFGYYPRCPWYIPSRFNPFNL